MIKVLISAYGCEPNKGSEQGVGWNWCLQLAQVAEVVVITRSNNQQAIEAALPAELIGHIHFEFYDLPSQVRRFKRREKGLYFYYLLWQWGAYRHARQLVRHSKFNYCMHLTFGSVWMPTFMHLLPLPFVWGPIGGGESVPFKLIGTLPLRGRIVQYLRYGLMATVPLNPLIMGIISRSRLILARTEDTARLIPPRYANKVRVVLETGMTDDLLAFPTRNGRSDTRELLRVIYTGRLIALKNVAAVIHAVALASRNTGLHLVLIGDGPLRSELNALASRLGIADKVEFRGTLPQSEVIDAVAKSDVYLFPSLKEGGVWSLMEAMSMGLPVICVKTSGMEVITDDSSAIRVEPISQGQMIEDFASALAQLARSPELRRQLGENARNRIREKFLWRHKVEIMASLFDEMEPANRGEAE